MSKAKTLAEIATQKGVTVEALSRKLRRAKIPVPSPEAALELEIMEFLLSDRRKQGNPVTSSNSRPTRPKAAKPRQNGLKSVFRGIPEIDWMKVLPVLPLPMLGLAASWGVFHFSAHFVPYTFAVIESAGFEFVYIGLSFTKSLREDLRDRVLKVSLAAVAVSVIYNSISAALYAYTNGDMAASQEMVKGLHPVLFWAGAILHGAPLAVLGFFVADLNLHKKKNE